MILTKDIFKNLVFFLAFILLMSIGLTSNVSSGVFYLFVVVGAFLFFLKRKEVEFFLNIDSKLFIYISYLLLLFLTLNVLFTDVSALFGWEYEVFRFIVFLPFIFYLFRCFNLSPVDVWKLLVLSGLYVIPVSFYIVINDLPRGAGVLENPILSGNLAMTFGVLSLISFFALKDNWWKFFAILVFVFGVMLSILSGSRGGWLGLIIGVVTIGFMLYKLGRIKSLLVTVFFVTILIFSALALETVFPVKDRIILAYSNIVDYFNGNVSTSVGYRLEMWLASYYGFLEKPLFGWGWGEFKTMHQAMSNLGFVSFMDFGQPHNDYIKFIVETGLIGFVLFISFILYPFVKFFSYASSALKNNDSEGFMFAITGIVFIELLLEFMLSDGNITYKYFMMFYLFISVHVFLYFSSEKRKISK